MKSTKSFLPVFSIALITLSLAIPTVLRAQTGYTITNLGSLGGSSATASAINNSGQIVGSSMITGDTAFHAFLYDSGIMKDINPVFAMGSDASAINNRGQVVGYTRAQGFGIQPTQGFFYQNGASTAIAFPNANSTTPSAINDNGVVVGYYAIEQGSYDRHAFIYNHGFLKDLPGVSFMFSAATGINNSGQIVGFSGYSITSDYFGYIVTSNVVTQIAPIDAHRIVPSAINASGQVTVLYSSAPSAYSFMPGHAFLYSSGVFTDLEASNGMGIFPLAINASGTIVGALSDGYHAAHAFLYQNGATIDLNSTLPIGSGWVLAEADSINDSGQICGYGIYNGHYAAFLLTPIKATVSGIVALEGILDLTQISPAAPLGTFHVSFRTPGTTTEVYGTEVTLTTIAGSPTGTFTVNNVLPGTYDVAIKGVKNLRVVLPKQIISGNIFLPDVLLPAGDANNDNSSDSTDFGILIGAFGGDATVVGSGYDPSADFNFDGSVDSTDFGLLIGEFNNMGSP